MIPTFRSWTHTSDDSYMYQLSLVVATATVSYTYAPGTVRVYLFSRFFFKCHIQGAHNIFKAHIIFKTSTLLFLIKSKDKLHKYKSRFCTFCADKNSSCSQPGYIHYKTQKRRQWDRRFRRNSYLQAAWDTSIARTSGFMHINISGMKHAIRKTVNLSNQTYLWIDCSIFYKKAYYLRGNLFGATDKSIRRIPTLKSLTDERYNTPSPWKTYEFSLYRRCLTLNFGDNAYHSHSNR